MATASAGQVAGVPMIAPMIAVEPAYTGDSNPVLKLKFQLLHSMIVDNVNAANITGFLFQQRVLQAQDMSTLQRQKSDPQQQCGDLLVLLHTSENPLAFVHLYRAIKNEPHLQWLIDELDKKLPDRH